MRRLNRYVEEQAPWQLAKDAASADAARSDARVARRGRARDQRAAAPVHAGVDRAAARRARRPGGWFRWGRLRGPVWGGCGQPDRAAVPQALVTTSRPTARDDRQPHPPGALRAARRRARRGRGRRRACARIVTVGIDGASCRAALAAAEDFPQVYAAIGRHPNAATGFDDADLAELKALAAHEKCVAIGETGLDYYRDYAPRADQERAFAAQIELARETGKPLVIHTRAADDDTLAMLGERASGLRVILHCFSMADRIEECLAHEDWWISFAGNVTYPKAAPLREAMLRVPLDRLLVETDAPYLSPQARARQAERAGERRAHRAGARGRAAGPVRRARRRGRAQRRRGVRMVSAPRRGARQRELGQNFLVDRNILDVIERLAALGPDDVVLEIGGGLGVLSERLAARVGARARGRDRPPARAVGCATRWRRSTTSRCTFADALELDLGALEPPPTKVVANLPYGIAATVILRTIDELPTVERLGRDGPARGRRAARGSAGTAAYGVPSVLAQLACEVRVLRAVARTVFRPVPNVDSVLVGLRRAAARRRPGAARARPRRLRPPAQGARGVARARRRARRPTSASARARRCVELGHPADERAERLSPEEFRVARGEARRGEADARSRRARSTSACSSGAVPRRRPPRARDAVRVGVARRRADARETDGRGATRSSARASPGPNLVARALAGLRARGWDAPPVRIEIDKRIPVAAGMGGGSADAAAALRLAVELAPGRPEEVVVAGGVARRRRAEPARARARARDRRGRACVEPFAPLAPHAFVIVPQPVALVDGRGLPRGRPARAAARRRRAARRATRELVAALVPGGRAARRADRQRPRAGGAVAVPGDRAGARRGPRRPVPTTCSCAARDRPSPGCSGAPDAPARASRRGRRRSRRGSPAPSTARPGRRRSSDMPRIA